jgi:hypothetical protein
MEYGGNLFFEKIVLKKWTTSFAPLLTIGGGKKMKSEIIYLQNNPIFDVVNIHILYFIFVNLNE